MIEAASYRYMRISIYLNFTVIQTLMIREYCGSSVEGTNLILMMLLNPLVCSLLIPGLYVDIPSIAGLV